MKNKQTILVDMDGVLADVYQSYFKYIKETRNEILTEADCMGKCKIQNPQFRHRPSNQTSITALMFPDSTPVL